MVKRKPSEEWFPGWFGSLWREVPPKENPYQALKSLFSECGIKPRSIRLKAIANNVFHNLKETFNVFLFIVEVDKKPSIKHVPEGEGVVWMRLDEMEKNDKVMPEYKRVFPRLKENEIIFYHTEYDFDKLINMKFFD